MSINQTSTSQHIRSVTEKNRLLIEWQQSKVTMKSFCMEKGISLSGLKTWIKQFDMGRKRYPAKKIPPFISVIPDQALNGSTPFVEYILPDSSRLVIHHPVTAMFLKELLDIEKG
ncbi:hypothetical protein [Chitinophaga sp. S165]|uniref:IS66 family insertion sequence element accessory protein TnpA n=1 Tax=Chitinophaga sp. S165 TaxID=2135462 RepID=UPI000D70AD59|nr:hypothetical protein [Chitinophaga sp. S165]